MVDQWLGTTGEQVWLVAVSGVAILLVAIAMIRLSGLRSLSKMSSFDFVVTLSFGSIVASVAATSTSLWNGALAFAVLLAVQWLIAKGRLHLGLGRVVDNRPVLLMDGSTFVDEHLTRSRVTRNDVMAKLREANVTDIDHVLGVVLETTGDVTVLHGEGPLDDRLLDGVRRPADSRLQQ